MKSKINYFFLFISLFFGMCLQAQYSGGNGDVATPYEIATLTDLETLSATTADWNKHFIQTADINASATSGWNNGLGFSPIGNNSVNFSGFYDGQEYTIKDLFINRPLQNYVGLFGRTSNVSILQNIGLIDGGISGQWNVGGLVGTHYGIITNSNFIGSVTGDSSVGGLVGSNWGVSISKSFTKGNISGNSLVGGLIGHNIGEIINCYSRANVIGVSYVGGLAGAHDYWITNNYSTGSVTGSNFVGGLMGENWGSSSANSFWDIETSGQTTSADGIGKTTVEMKTESTFTDLGWDFTNIWYIVEGINDGYPQFCFGTPTIYNVTGGGDYCSDSIGVAVGLDNSESNTFYQLKLDNINIGTAIEGTGSVISFGYQTLAGIYTVEAAFTGSACRSTMTGSALVTITTSTSHTTIVSSCDSYTWPENGIVYTTTGIYSNVNGCHTEILDLTIIESPSNQVTQSGNTLTAAEPDAIYQWFICESNGTFTPIIGETNQSYFVTAIGSYAVEVTQNNCTIVSNCFDMTVLDISDFYNSSFSYYPNPTSGIITLKYAKEISEVRVVNLLGQNAYTQHVNSSEVKVDITGLPDAVYLMQVVSEGTTKTIKVIKSQ